MDAPPVRLFCLALGWSGGRIPKALADLDELIAEADPVEAAFLQEYRAHCASRMERAMLTLSAPIVVPGTAS